MGSKISRDTLYKARGWGWGRQGRSCAATRRFLDTLLYVFVDGGAADHLEEL